MQKKYFKWQDIFNKLSKKYAIKFVDDVDTSVTKQLKSSFEEIPQLLVVPFSKHNQQVLMAQQDKIKQNVNLITGITDKTMKEQIQIAVTEALLRGRDVRYLEKRLLEIGIKTENRVKLIARDQINNATSVINHARQDELGITKNKWVYTYESKEPESHKKANGKVYDINKGCEIDGEYIYPGEKSNCSCISAPVFEFD